MTPLVITPELKNRAHEIIDYAKNNIIDIVELHRKGQLKENQPLPLPGDDEKFTLYIPTNFKVVYSHENQGNGMDKKLGLGICRHLSMSIGEQGRVPNFIAIDMILELFEFINPIYKCIMWAEEFGGNSQLAVNVLEPLKGWPNEDIAKEIEENSSRVIGETHVDAIKQRRRIG